MFCSQCVKLANIQINKICPKCSIGRVLNTISNICDNCSKINNCCSACLKKINNQGNYNQKTGCRSCGRG